MAYTTNPRQPRLRSRACEMVRQGKSVSEVARYFGYSKGAVSKWLKKYPKDGAWVIETKSSRPKNHPRQTDEQTVNRIVQLRKDLKGRCGEVIHDHLNDEGIKISLPTVQRVLDRKGLLNKRSPWKRSHISVERPKALNPGDLVQIDTIHIMKNSKERIYVYTLIDVHSRWAYAEAHSKANTLVSIDFTKRAQAAAPFQFKMIQSDNGPEFSKQFTDRVKISHRHSRVRKPNDNAHLERFNRTIQQEFLNSITKEPFIINLLLPIYLKHYNTTRKHLGIGLKTPQHILNKCFQAIV